MSRIGKQPVIVPSGVEVKLDGGTAFIKGPKGEISLPIHPLVNVRLEGNTILVEEGAKSKESAALWGLIRAKLANLVTGATKGFEKKLELEGVGYRAHVQGSTLNLTVGFTHPVEFAIPKGITATVEKNVITISGIDKEIVGEVASKIRSIKKPEPYKGAGIRYQGEHIIRKVGKKAATSA